MSPPDWPIALGILIRDGILFCASLLKYDSAPGLVTLFLVLALLIAWARFWLWQTVRSRAIRKALDIVRSLKPEPMLSGSFATLSKSMRDALPEGAGPRGAVRLAWDEFVDTVITPPGNGPDPVVFNTIRPAVFFGTEEMGFSPGAWRMLPSLFVSVGLFLTFLGLISALGEAAEKLSTDPDQAIQGLLAIASAKFIMSLTGLLCSIVFGIVLRRGTGRLERHAHDLAVELERRFAWTSLEATALDQLDQLRDLKQHMTAQTTALVAELGQALDSRIADLGRAIAGPVGQAVTDAMAPVLAGIAQQGQSGVTTMVEELGAQFNQNVGSALGHASTSLGQAADRLDGLATRFGDALGTASADLARAAETLRESAAGAAGETRDALSEALRETLGGLKSALAEVQAFSEEAAGRTGQVLHDGSEKLLAGLDGMLAQIRDNTGRGAEAMDRAATAMTQAADRFGEKLGTAARDAAEQMQAGAKQAAEAAGGALGTAGQEAAGALGKEAIRLAESLAKIYADATGKAGEIAAALDAVAGKALSAAEQASLMADRMERSAAVASNVTKSVESFGEKVDASATELARTLIMAATDASDRAGRIGQALDEVTDKARDATSQASLMAERMEQGATAAATISRAAESFGGRLEGSATELAQKLAAAAAVAARTAGEIAGALVDVTGKARDATGQAALLAERMEGGASAVERAAGAFDRAAGSVTSAAGNLAGAAEPVRLATSGVLEAAATVTQSGQEVARQATMIAEETRRVLSGTAEALNMEREGIRTTLGRLADVLGRLEGEEKRLAKIDAALAEAFEEVRRQLQAALGDLSGHVEKTAGAHAEALNRLNTVLQSLQAFNPDRGN